jgi:hypothetical protein
VCSGAHVCVLARVCVCVCVCVCAARSDPVERLKLVVAFAVGGMRQQVSCDKPFNPILVRGCAAGGSSGRQLRKTRAALWPRTVADADPFAGVCARLCVRACVCHQQGETLQGVYPCGCSVAAEQVSHHPPVSCWQVRDHAGRVSASCGGVR